MYCSCNKSTQNCNKLLNTSFIMNFTDFTVIIRRKSVMPITFSRICIGKGYQNKSLYKIYCDNRYYMPLSVIQWVNKQLDGTHTRYYRERLRPSNATRVDTDSEPTWNVRRVARALCKSDNAIGLPARTTVGCVCVCVRGPVDSNNKLSRTRPAPLFGRDNLKRCVRRDTLAVSTRRHCVAIPIHIIYVVLRNRSQVAGLRKVPNVPLS